MIAHVFAYVTVLRLRLRAQVDFIIALYGCSHLLLNSLRYVDANVAQVVVALFLKDLLF